MLEVSGSGAGAVLSSSSSSSSQAHSGFCPQVVRKIEQPIQRIVAVRHTMTTANTYLGPDFLLLLLLLALICCCRVLLLRTLTICGFLCGCGGRWLGCSCAGGRTGGGSWVGLAISYLALPPPCSHTLASNAHLLFGLREQNQSRLKNTIRNRSKKASYSCLCLLGCGGKPVELCVGGLGCLDCCGGRGGHLCLGRALRGRTNRRW